MKYDQLKMTNHVLCKLTNHWLLNLKLLLHSAYSLVPLPRLSMLPLAGTTAQPYCYSRSQGLIEYYTKGLVLFGGQFEHNELRLGVRVGNIRGLKIYIMRACPKTIVK